MNQDPKKLIQEAVEKILNAEGRGFVIVGTFDGVKMDTKATMQNIPLGDLSVALARVVTGVEVNIAQQMEKDKKK